MAKPRSDSCFFVYNPYRPPESSELGHADANLRDISHAVSLEGDELQVGKRHCRMQMQKK